MSEVMKFEIASKQGVILETEGRYCPQNIKVVPKLSPLTATKNGAFPVPDGYCGYSDVVVDLGLKSLTTSEGGTYKAADEGVVGYDVVKFEPKLFDMEVNDNGTYTAPDGYTGFGQVTVNVDPVLTLEYIVGVASGGVTLPITISYSDLGYEYDPEIEGSGLRYLFGPRQTLSHSVRIYNDDGYVSIDSIPGGEGTCRVTLIDEVTCRIVARILLHKPSQ